MIYHLINEYIDGLLRAAARTVKERHSEIPKEGLQLSKMEEERGC